jgi:hypothetical protein
MRLIQQEAAMDAIEAKVTNYGWLSGDTIPEPKRCRCCGKNWVTREVVCRACKPIYKYRRSDYYFLRSIEVKALDMGVQAWL